MRVLYLTHSVIGDRSYGGPMRGNALRDALCECAEVDTVTVYSAGRFDLPVEWGPDRSRTATLTTTGVSRTALVEKRALRRWLRRLVGEGGYDAVVAQYVELASLLPRGVQHGLLFDPDDFRKSASPGSTLSAVNRVKLVRRNRLARQVARRARHVWYVNPAVGQLPPTTRRSFLPNVVTMPDSDRARAEPVPGRILMVGSFFHPPNVEGLTWFATCVLPDVVRQHHGVTLHVVGRHDDDLPTHLPDVVFHGFVDDLTSVYDQAELVVAPIRSGGGTQIKVIDALAHGRPLVSSEFAYAGFAGDLVGGAGADTDLLTATSASEWVQHCRRVLSDRTAAEAMGRRGEAAVRRSLGPERMTQAVRETLASLV